MTKPHPTVHTSGASLSAGGAGARAMGRHGSSASSSRAASRTIVETAACPPELKRGDKPWSISDFRVQKMLGEGNMSSVVHCVCCRSGAHVAVKMYHRDRMNSMNVKQVSREIEIHASLLHPNIVRLFAAFEDDDGIYLVQEYAARGDLYVELSRRGGYLPEQQVVKGVLIPFLSALTYMHNQGVLHRDIKPENIMLGADGDIKVGDFGLAINTTREKPMSRVGTLDYMPPEIVRLPYGSAAKAAAAAGEEASAAYGLPVDTWCVGVLAFELLIGAPPFEAESKEATYTRILKLEPALPSHLSDHARDFMRQALQKDPSKRPTVHALLRHPWLKAYQRPKSMVVVESASKAAANAGGTPSLLTTAPARAPSHAVTTATVSTGGSTAGAAPTPQAGEKGKAAAATAATAAAGGTAADTAAGEPAGLARNLKSLSFGSAMAGRFSEVRPSKPAAFSLLMRTKAHGSLAPARSGLKEGAGPSALAQQGAAAGGSEADRRHSSSGVRGSQDGSRPSAAAQREAAARAAVAEVDAALAAAGAAQPQAATDEPAAGASAEALGSRSATGAAGSGAGDGRAADDLIRAVPPDDRRAGAASAARAVGATSGPPRATQAGGPRTSFAAAIKRKLSGMGGGLFSSSASSEGPKDEATAAAIAAAAAAAAASEPSAATAAGAAMGAIGAVQAPSMLQLLSPPPRQAQMPRAGSLKRTNSGGRFFSALGKRFSLGGRRSAAGSSMAAAAAAATAGCLPDCADPGAGPYSTASRLAS